MKKFFILCIAVFLSSCYSGETVIPIMQNPSESSGVQNEDGEYNEKASVDRLYNSNCELVLEAEKISFSSHDDAILFSTGEQYNIYSLKYGKTVLEDVSTFQFYRHFPIPSATYHYYGQENQRWGDVDGYNWIRVEKNGTWQYFDVDDHYKLVLDSGLVAHQEDSYAVFIPTSFRNNMAIIVQPGDIALLFDRKGNIIKTFQNVRRAEWVSAGYMLTFHDDRTAILDRNGEQIFEYPKTLVYSDTPIRFFPNGNVMVDVSNNHMHADLYNKRAYRLYGSSGQLIEEFLSADTSDLDFILVQKQDGMYAFIDSNGDNVFGEEYDYATAFSEGLAVVHRKNRSGSQYINTQGELITEQVFGNAEPFIDGRAVVSNLDYTKHAIIDKDGNLLTDYMDFQISLLRNGNAIIKAYEEGGYKRGLIDRHGEVILEPTSNFKWWYPADDGYYFIATEYGEMATIRDYYIDKSVVMDDSGNMLFKDMDTYVTYLGHGLFYIAYYDEVTWEFSQKTGEYERKVISTPNRIVDRDGETVLLLGNARLSEYYNGYFIVGNPTGIVQRPEGIGAK